MTKLIPGFPPLSVLVLLASGVSAVELGPPVTGPAHVIDGDTLDVGSTRVRLHGIDAPELKQRCTDSRKRVWSCGTFAANRVQAIIAGRPVVCQGRQKDDYGRVLAVCTVAGQDINAQLVREGLAWAFVRYSMDYAAIEGEARAGKRGVFAAANVAPWDFRSGEWEGARQVTDAEKARACPIKGNVGREGERVYHLPWQRDYARTKINESAGERWFCSEGEAEKAGWRRAAR